MLSLLFMAVDKLTDCGLFFIVMGPSYKYRNIGFQAH
jgi:hypothetical protein